MITISERVEIMSALTEKAMILKESAGHDVVVEWYPILKEITIRAYAGGFELRKLPICFNIEFKKDNAIAVYEAAMNYLNNMEKTSEAEAQNG